MSKKKYTIVGVDSNAFSVMGYVSRAMRDEGKTQEEVEAYRKGAMGGSYSELIVFSEEVCEALNACKKRGVK
jgi:hypothetical protein